MYLLATYPHPCRSKMISFLFKPIVCIKSRKFIVVLWYAYSHASRANNEWLLLLAIYRAKRICLFLHFTFANASQIQSDNLDSRDASRDNAPNLHYRRAPSLQRCLRHIKPRFNFVYCTQSENNFKLSSCLAQALANVMTRPGRALCSAID